jgi:hypothetical protein
MRGAWRRCWGDWNADTAGFPRHPSSRFADFPRSNLAASGKFAQFSTARQPVQTASVECLWKTRYSAANSASSASVSTWAAATQSDSDADSAGVWLAPVGFLTNSIADGRTGARMPASWPA